MSDLFWETITPDMRRILGGFTQSELGAKFYLAGGTALALQLGHRISVDLDFFSPTEDIPTLRHALEKVLAVFSPALADSAWGNLVYLAQDVRIGFYGYGYELVAPLVETQDARLASVEDIGLRKLDALLARCPDRIFMTCTSSAKRSLFEGSSTWRLENTLPCMISKPRLSNAWCTSKTPKRIPLRSSLPL